MAATLGSRPHARLGLDAHSVARRWGDLCIRAGSEDVAPGRDDQRQGGRRDGVSDEDERDDLVADERAHGPRLVGSASQPARHHMNGSSWVFLLKTSLGKNRKNFIKPRGLEPSQSSLARVAFRVWSPKNSSGCAPSRSWR